jgi:hypothetical protein
MKRLCALMLCALLGAVTAVAPALACATKRELVQRIAAEAPGIAVAVIDGDAADALAIGIAQFTGGSVPAGGEYALIDLPESRLTYVVRFSGGCATHHGRFPTALVHRWIAGLAVEGERHAGR